MATLKQRCHRHNGSGYDVVHFETEADCVLMSNGQTLSQYISTMSVGVFEAGTSAPSDTKKLWIDTNSNMGLKYYNGSSWVPVAVMYT